MTDTDTVVKTMIRHRFDGPTRADLESMLFDEPQSRLITQPSQVRDGRPLSDAEKTQIRALGASGMAHSAIADQVGVSRQAVTGALSAKAKTRETTS